MEPKHRFQRPPFEEAAAAWEALLGRRGLATDLLWILDDDLCFERDPQPPGRTRLGFQTLFTPHPPDAAKVTYHHFAEMDARIVFYRLGSSRGRSVCMQLCDPWFEPKSEADGYIRHDDWLISFHPGPSDELEEIAEPKRWERRVVRGRPLSAVDFCMTLAALRELKAHGRVLTPDERFGLKILRSMHQVGR